MSFKSGALLRVFIISAFLVLVSFPRSYGQGLLLEKGGNGFGIDAGLAFGEGTSAIGVYVGYSIFGILDLSFGVENSSFPEEEFGDDFKATGIFPGLVFYPLKQSDEIPISLSTSFSYGNFKYRGDFLSVNNFEMKGSSYSLGMGLYHRALLSEKVSIIPGIGLSYSFIMSMISDSFGDSEEDKDDFVSVSISLPIVFLLPQNQYLNLSPSVLVGNETIFFGVSLGFTLATKADAD